MFYPISNEDEWPLYDGPMIVPLESMKCIGSGRPKSTWLHNEMDVREGETNITCGLYKQPVTIGGLVRTEIEFSDSCEVTHLGGRGQFP